MTFERRAVLHRRRSTPGSLYPVFSLLLGMGLVACGSSSEDEDPGTLRVILEPEDTIIDGLGAGSGVEDIRDGWKVTYEKYLLGVGHVALEYATDEDVTAEDSDAFIVDLTQIPANGERFWQIGDLRPGRWNFGFEFVGGGHGPKRHSSVDEADFERMVEEDFSHLIVGTLTKEEGQSCPPERHAGDISGEAVGENDAGDPCYSNTTIQFEFTARAEAIVDHCELDGVPGVAITSGATSTDAVTVHGDHLFFNGFPDGDEGGVLRLAQVWADADLNVDGRIDTAEFQDVLIADMSEWDDRYQEGGKPVVTLGDVVVEQLKTQGHLNGEGDCLVNGEGHEH
jgi:hypothetical protein